MWTPQAQFAGYLVAQEKGFYKEEGLEVEIRPAGPDLKPQNTVAAGSDDIAVGVSNQVVASRSNGVPLVIVAQVFQDSANRYVLKKSNKINSLTDLKGMKVGLWTGGDEAEFVAMLKTVGLTLNDVTLVPEGYSVAPFVNGDYLLSMVTTYNELNQLRSMGLTDDKLQILAPSDYHSAIAGDMIFTSQKYIDDHPDIVKKFVSASIKGWKYAAEHPDDTLNIVLKSDSSLKLEEQRSQLAEVIKLMLKGKAASDGIGYMDPETYATTERVLFDSAQISTHVAPQTVFNDSFWKSIPISDKIVGGK